MDFSPFTDSDYQPRDLYAFKMQNLSPQSEGWPVSTFQNDTSKLSLSIVPLVFPEVRTSQLIQRIAWNDAIESDLYPMDVTRNSSMEGHDMPRSFNHPIYAA